MHIKQSFLKKIRSSLFIVLTFILPPLFWAMNFIIGRVLHTSVPPATLTLARWSIALLIILPFAFPHILRDFKYYQAHLPRIVAISLSGITLFSLLVYSGLHYTSSANALLLNSFVPVLIILFSTLFFKVKIRLRQLTGLIISTSGVLFIVFKGQPHNLLKLSFSYGDLLLLSAMACFALYSIWLKKIPQHINRMGLLGVQVIITLFAILPFFWFEQRAQIKVDWSIDILKAILFLGIFPSFCSYILYGRCVEILGPSKASLSIHLIPVFGIAISTLLLREHIYLFQLIGISIIFTGIYLANINHPKGNTHEKRNC